MADTCFLTRSYKGGYIRSKESGSSTIWTVLFNYTVHPVRSERAAKIKITRLMRGVNHHVV